MEAKLLPGVAMSISNSAGDSRVVGALHLEARATLDRGCKLAFSGSAEPLPIPALARRRCTTMSSTSC